MIKVGHDICSIDRFASLMDREAFLRKIFGEDELSEARKEDRFDAQYLAGRWVAKESLSKALGLGIFDWNLTDAQYLRKSRVWVFTGSMKRRLSSYLVETSLSYEKNLASAVTIVVMK